MKKHITYGLGIASATLLGTSAVLAGGTSTWFTPLTESAPVTAPNSLEELNSPWITPADIVQTNLLSLDEVEADPTQSIIRVPAGRSSSMIDMIAYDDTGEFLFLPHETPFGAGATRYDLVNDTSHVIFQGDMMGILGDYSNDFGAFDPCRFTPNGTLFLAEEWAGEGRVIEVLNPFAAPQDIEARELHSIANVAHEGINFSEKYDDTIYFVDENRSGSIYKFVMTTVGDYTQGQTFVLSVDSFGGDVTKNYNDAANAGQPRTGQATWIPITKKNGTKMPGIAKPFDFKPVNSTAAEKRNANAVDKGHALGGRQAADDAGGTPYGRPEDMEVSQLANGNEVFYFAATSERTIYSVEILGGDQAMVGVLVDDVNFPKNEGFDPTTGEMNSPDNLSQDALGNIYVIEDAPNSSDVGGDIWFVRDANNDGVAESLDHFLSIRVDGSEATGMIFNPVNPTEFVVAVQHPDSTDLSNVPDGFGDAVWKFEIEDADFVNAVE